MKAKTVQEVRKLLRSDEFIDWRDRYLKRRGDLENAHARFSDQLLHTVWRAGEYEDLSARAHTEFIELDDDFEALSAFEVQRQRTSDLWIELHKAEKVLEDHRQAASELRQKIEVRRKGRRMTANVDEFQRRESELGDLESVIENAAREAENTKAQFDEAVKDRDRRWVEVEIEWTQAFRANMARAEYIYAARRERAKSELAPKDQAGAQEKAEPSVDDEEINAEVDEIEQDLAALILEAEQKFGCILIVEFLYWPQQDDVRAAICVPLIHERDHLNLQITPSQVYEVERAKGIEFIAPVPEEDEDNDDPRLEAFFLKNRAHA